MRKKLVTLLLAAMMLLPLLSFAEAPAEFDIAIVRWTDGWGTDFTEVAVLKELEAKQNVKINWNTYYYGDWSEQKSLLLASGNLPDVFWAEITLNDTDIAQNQECFVDLAELIPQYMPNLTRIFEQDPTMKALCTNRDGKIFSLPKRLPLRPITANEFYINHDWLEKLNLSVPTTYTELADVLEAFMKGDPNGNGEADEIGFTGTGTARNDVNGIMIPFGTMTSRSGSFMGLNKEGSPYFVPTAENYKAGVAWMHELYTRGIIPEEYFTQTSDMVNAKTQAEGGSLTGLSIAWTADAGVAVNAPQFKVLEAVAGPDGERYVESDPTYLNYARNEFVVTKNCEDVPKLLAFVDQFYDDLVSLQTYYGSIADGKISANEDGTYTVLVPDDGMSLDTSCWTFSFRDHGPKYMNKEFESKIILPDNQGDGIKLADDKVNAAYARDNFPVVAYTDEQLLELATLSTDIRNYVEQMYAGWVVNGGIEEQWNDYINQLNAMGLERYVAIYNDAYAAYKAN